MSTYNIELVNFTPVPDSTLLEYFSDRLDELAANPKVSEIKTAKLVSTMTKPPITTPADYLLSQQVNTIFLYHTCQIVVVIKNVECNIVDYDGSYFKIAIDKVINEALSRCFRYD